MSSAISDTPSVTTSSNAGGSPTTPDPHANPTTDLISPTGGIFPRPVLDRSQTSANLGFDRQFAWFSKNNMPNASHMNTRQATLAIYDRFNIVRVL